MTLKKSTSFLIMMSLLCTAAGSIAQVKPDEKKDPQKTAITEEIDVVRAYKPVLAEAVKIRRSPDLQNTAPFKPSLTYSIPDRRLELNGDIRKLQAQELANETEQPLRNNYISAGAGTLNTGIAGIYLNTGKDEALQAGGFFNYLNQDGTLKGQHFSQEKGGVYGRSIRDQLSMTGNLGFDHSAFKFYGADPAAPAPPAAPAQHYDLFTVSGELKNRYDEASPAVNYTFGADAYVLKNAFHASENSFLLHGLADKKLGAFHLGANAQIDLTGTKDSLTDVSNTILKGNPFMSLQGKGYQVIAGLNVFRETLGARTNVFPAVSAEVEVVPGFATVFGAYTGDVLKTSLRGLSDVNLFIGENIAIKNAVERMNISGGLKGNAGSGFGYKATASYRKVEDLPLFVNLFPNIQKFGVVYDKSTEIVGFEGEVSFNSPGIFKLTGKVIGATYHTSSEQEAWFKPGLQLISNASFFVNKNLVVNGEVVLNGESKALVSSTAPTGSFITTVGSFTDLSAGAEYRLKGRTGLFVRVNNLLDSKYERYLFYPSTGLNVFGGLNYSF